jgi:hypothetical protein
MYLLLREAKEARCGRFILPCGVVEEEVAMWECSIWYGGVVVCGVEWRVRSSTSRTLMVNNNQLQVVCGWR